MKKLVLLLCGMALHSLLLVPAFATIVDSADVAGLHTFTDQSTGRVWLDLNNFFGLSVDQMVGIATPAGFTVANNSDVVQLVSSLANPNANWTYYADVMGQAPNRDLIWGASDYDTSGNSHMWTWAFSNETSWTFNSSSVPNNVVPNAGTDFADLNLWAYQNGSSSPVPEPSTFILFGAGLASVAFMRRRIKK